MIGVYRALLRLYPAGFRREYGEAMVDIFAERALQAQPRERLVLLLGACVEVVWNALVLHADGLVTRVSRDENSMFARRLRRVSATRACSSSAPSKPS